MEPTAKPAILHHFAFAHLPPHLAAVSRPFHHAAQGLAAGHRWALLELETLAATLRATPGDEAAAGAAKLVRLIHRATRLDDWAASIAGWLRLLLEARDCAVRAAADQHQADAGDTMARKWVEAEQARLGRVRLPDTVREALVDALARHMPRWQAREAVGLSVLEVQG